MEEKEMGYNITIDGPAGAGKSTVAKLVARELDFIYVDTGAMYRAIAYFFLKNGIESLENVNVRFLCDQMDIRISYEGNVQKVFLNDEDVTQYLRDEAVGKMASVVAVDANVREKLLGLQKYIASEADVVMDGRDIGTKVLPDAQLKIYLTASVEVRAKRRFDELTQKGVACDIEEIKKDIEQRDEKDMKREIAPLCKAEDAVLVDSSDMTIDEVTDTIIKLYEEK